MAVYAFEQTYLRLRDDVDVQVGRLLLAKLATEFFHLAQGRLRIKLTRAQIVQA